MKTELTVNTFTRITVDPKQMGGLPCIRGLRISVATVVGMVGEGTAETEILAAYPDLEVEDVREALRYRGGGRPRAGASRHWWFLRFVVDNALSPLIAEVCDPQEGQAFLGGLNEKAS